jgi:hypothetical protein
MENCATLSIQSDLSSEEWDKLIHIWLQERMTPCSLGLFDDLKAEGVPLAECLEKAIRNDIVVEVLQAGIFGRQKAQPSDLDAPSEAFPS